MLSASTQIWQRSRGLLGKLAWLMAAEGMSRASRLITLFALAAAFSASEYGLAMLALVIHELMRVFTRLGIGAKIIQSSEAELPDLTRNAATLQWLLALLLALMQIACAEFIARFYEQALLADLLRIMALSHIVYPLVAMRVFHLHRRNAMRYYGLASGACITFENLLIAVLVMTGMDVFAVAWAKVAAALFWVALFCRVPQPYKGLTWRFAVVMNICHFGSKTLGSEMIRSLRVQIDSLIAGRLLSPELFGVYSFAKSAGLGIAQSLSQAYLTVLYPYLCEQHRAQSLNSAVALSLRITAVFSVGLLAMAALAPIYIEALFEGRWHDAHTLCQILLLVAIPALVFDHLVLTMRVRNRAGHELMAYLGSIALIATALLGFANNAAMHIATLMLLGTSASVAVALLLVLRPVNLHARSAQGRHVGVKSA